MVKNLACCQRELALRMYDAYVIPLTRSVGVIEWIPNTTTIQSVISNQYIKQTPFSEVVKVSHYGKLDLYIKGISQYKRNVKKMRQLYDFVSVIIIL